MDTQSDRDEYAKDADERPPFEPTLIPCGEYVVKFQRYETRRFQGCGGKVFAYFCIVEDDQFAGSVVERFYNVDRLNGPPGDGGKFVAPVRGLLYREVTGILGASARPDRVPLARLRGKRIKAEIVAVRRDRNGIALPKCHWYNKIGRLIEALPDENWSAVTPAAMRSS